MKLPRHLLAAATFASLTAGVAAAEAAPPAPRGKHPRIWLTDPTVAAMKAKLGDASSAAAKVVARCKAMASKPNRTTNGDDWTWSFGAPSCALAWKLTGDATYAATGVALFKALLDDNDKVGDGAGGDTVIQHDSGYDIRVFGPYAALCYDWLHEAPGVDAALLTHARARFKAWVDWYTATGYLNDTPGSNYHAGYVFAKTLIAVAAAGEDTGVSDAYWADVNDKIFATQLVKVGLAPGGALSGGDWPEGWQYGPLSVVSYALSARALEEQGSPQPEMRQWASDLTLAYLYAVPPKKDGVFTDGDLDNDVPLADINPRPFLATMAWGGSDQAAGFAASFRKTVTMREDNPVFDALAEARGAAPIDFESTKPSLWYLAKGTRKLFARSAWAPDATWAMFTAAPRLVPDHQHVDASNFVFARGADHLIADPSPYGSLSTLTGNALTVDSNTVETQDKPSQSIWENASELPWARAVTSGIAASRADLSGAFSGRDNVKSDVPFAKRDWAYLPEGDIVVIDRARTDDARKMHVRFRTPATLTVSATAPFIANGGVGGSALFIHAVQLSGGTPKLRTVAGGGSCDSAPTYGVCDAARFKVTEYFVDVPGPQMLAVHVMDGLGPSDQGPAALAMNDPAVDTTPPQNAGVVGASVRRGATQNYVVSSSAKDGAAGATLSYGVPGDLASRHVVFDAPEDATGKSNVKTTAANGRCVVTITAGSGANAFAGRPLVFSVASAAAGCTTAEDTTVTPGGVPPGGVTPPGDGGGGGGGAGGNGNGPGAASDSGCGCRAAPSSVEGWAALGALAGIVAVGARRLGRKR